MQFSMQFYVNRGPGLFEAMRLSFVRRDGTGRRNRLKICRGSLPVKVDSFHWRQKLHRPIPVHITEGYLLPQASAHT
jgi:hypothetical protein